ncbi:MAG TPA: serine/threonine-protein kinase [Gemmata sp.]|nr:serine/threonine-protein kinase [Gemmata sp.]
MPPPTTVPELLDRVRRSGIVPTDRLEGFLVGLQTSQKTPANPKEMLDRLVEAGMITGFHADRLAEGKYKGFQLGSYLILDQIGTGGMGQVYLAEHINMRRLVALKVLPPYSFDDAVARERFFREARAAGTLDHPNIVRVFDLCQEGKLLFLVMEYVEGVSLQSVVSRFGPIAVDASCHYARQVAFGLQHAHELGFVHRDIKPANLLIDNNGVIKILDLGLVRSEADRGSGLTRQLDNKSILGTADYVAPEQAVDSSQVDIRADLYALGATLYFILAGRPLFPEGRTAQKLVWQQIKEPVPVDRLRPEVSKELSAIVHRLLQKKPIDRFQTPLEVFEALEPFVTEQVPVPDTAWLPIAPARVAFARTAAQNANTPRTSGSTSQILAAALNTRSGVTSNSSVQRKNANKHSGQTSDSDKMVIAPSAPSTEQSTSSTNAIATEDTQRTPGKDSSPLIIEALKPEHVYNPTLVIGTLASALLLSLLGIIILLLRGS